MGGQILEAACMPTDKLAKVEELFDEKTLEVASKRFRGGIGLQELLLDAARANGFSGRNFRDSRSVLRFAFGQNLQAAFSTIDVGGIDAQPFGVVHVFVAGQAPVDTLSQRGQQCVPCVLAMTRVGQHGASSPRQAERFVQFAKWE